MSKVANCGKFESKNIAFAANVQKKPFVSCKKLVKCSGHSRNGRANAQYNRFPQARNPTVFASRRYFDP